ncbi:MULTISPECIES: JAB domain-containing protein [Arenibacter]|uniref:RadC-like JAB domain-containing protein n=1 Tax=Arenibacter troitsensis TaxID=188872 RepID=A0A1X7LGS6_9FLAO|nr:MULTISPECIES: JAB domain-containing protein [Arenibacter]MCK0135549.1 JAB domain-containing protein [Arenibacter sp. S6351L]SMG52452.1 RadC-like JAB domain-containing protein [Arenibacter troitsensis]
MNYKVNEIKISYKEQIRSPFWHIIGCSQDAANILFDQWNKNTIALQECFKVVLLNNSNKVKGILNLSQGGITGTLVDVRILFAAVLKSLSVAIILCHNHPSGKLKASEADIQLTDKIKKAAALLDIKVLDHLIIAPDGQYFSFSDNGLI